MARFNVGSLCHTTLRLDMDIVLSWEIVWFMKKGRRDKKGEGRGAAKERDKDKNKESLGKRKCLNNSLLFVFKLI